METLGTVKVVARLHLTWRPEGQIIRPQTVTLATLHDVTEVGAEDFWEQFKAHNHSFVNECAEVEVFATWTVERRFEVRELTKRLDACSKRIETYFNVKRD